MRKKVSITDMLTIANSGYIGHIEFRNWLAGEYPKFKKARREDIDTVLEEVGQTAAKEIMEDQDFGD